MQISASIRRDALALDPAKEIERIKDIKTADIMSELSKVYTKKDQKNLIARVGSRTYKDINDIRRAPLFSTIDITSASGQAVEAIKYVIVETYNEALRYADSFHHSNSFWAYQGVLGGRESVVTSASQIKNISDGVYTVINIAAYAAILEKHFLPDGIMYKVYYKTKRKFGANISIRYDYVAAPHYVKGSHGGTLPRIQITAPGRLRDGAVRPGSAKVRRRSYPSVKGRSR